MFDFVQKWRDKIIALVSTKVKLMQLDLIERSANVMSNLVLIFIFIFLGFGLFLFIGLGIAEFFSYLWDSRIGGYFSAALMFLIIGVIFYALRKKLVYKLSNRFIQVLTEEQDIDAEKDKPSS